jgi:(p)ppGpp synthase/HD superfamily hydrolase
MNLPLEALKFAAIAHKGQVRKFTNEPYYTHCYAVQEILRKYTGPAEPELLAAAALHDTLEDCPTITYQMIVNKFGEKVANIVQELTNVYTVKTYPTLNRADRKKKENERLATVSSYAQTVKAADIYHNTSDILKHNPALWPYVVEKFEQNNILTKSYVRAVQVDTYKHLYSLMMVYGA